MIPILLSHRFWTLPVLLISTLGMLTQAQAAEETLFRYQGFDVTPSDLSTPLRSALHEAEQAYYHQRQRLVDAALLELYLQEEAKRRGESEAELAARLLKPEEPDEAALRDFYDNNRERIGAPFEQVSAQIRQYLLNQRLQAKQADLLERIKAEGDFQLLLTKPQAPQVDIATEGFPSRGNPEAAVTVVEFADYQCPYCKRATPILEAVSERFGDQVRFIYLDLPVNSSGISRRVAQGAFCAGQQGRFWEYHDLAFARQESLNEQAPLELAGELDLDEAAFQACLNSSEAQAQVARAEAEAQRLGVTSTPTLFVNGRRLHAEDLERDLTAAIEEALESQEGS